MILFQVWIFVWSRACSPHGSTESSNELNVTDMRACQFFSRLSRQFIFVHRFRALNQICATRSSGRSVESSDRSFWLLTLWEVQGSFCQCHTHSITHRAKKKEITKGKPVVSRLKSRFFALESLLNHFLSKG